MRDSSGECMKRRNFVGDPNTLFKCQPLRHILRLQEDARGLAVVSCQFDGADSNGLGSAVDACIWQILLAHMTLVLERSVEYVPNNLTAGKRRFIRIPEEIGRG